MSDYNTDRCVECTKLYNLLCDECIYKWNNPNRNGCGVSSDLNPCNKCKDGLQVNGLLDENGILMNV